MTILDSKEDGKTDVRELEKQCRNYMKFKYPDRLFHTINEGEEEESLKIIIYETREQLKGLVIQLKAERRISNSEQKRLNAFDNRGYKALVICSFNSFEDAVQFYFNPAKPFEAKYSKNTMQKANSHYRKMKLDGSRNDS